MIRKAEEKDAAALGRMASSPEVWSGSPEELAAEFKELVHSEKDLVAVTEENGEIIAFANLRLRSEYVAGTDSCPVAYLEGIFVKSEHRGKGKARKLVEFCENWAKEHGCTEFGSDCLITNEASFAFHLALGFKEIERTISFAKKI